MIPSSFPPELTRLFAEPGVTDVLLSGGGLCQVVRGGILEPREAFFADSEEVDRLALTLIAAGGRQLDIAHPFADVILGGFRVHAALKNDSSRVTQLSIRFLGSRVTSLGQLEDAGMFDRDVGAGLRALVADRQNVLISGATGSGKTTLLRAFLDQAAGERIITIEDIPELRLGGQCVELLARRANAEGFGEISLEQLLHESLRMRPDRIVVGELRSRELPVLLQAMNSGHRGSGATIHANSIQDVPNRLRAIGLVSGLGFRELDALAASAFDWVIHLAVVSGVRRIAGIGRFELCDGILCVREVVS